VSVLYPMVCGCCVWQNPSSACERGDTLLTVASWDYAKTQLRETGVLQQGAYRCSHPQKR